MRNDMQKAHKQLLHQVGQRYTRIASLVARQRGGCFQCQRQWVTTDQQLPLLFWQTVAEVHESYV